MHSAAPTQAFGGWGGYVSYVDNYVDNYVATWSPPDDDDDSSSYVDNYVDDSYNEAAFGGVGYVDNWSPPADDDDDSSSYVDNYVQDGYNEAAFVDGSGYVNNWAAPEDDDDAVDNYVQDGYEEAAFAPPPYVPPEEGSWDWMHDEAMNAMFGGACSTCETVGTVRSDGTVVTASDLKKAFYEQDDPYSPKDDRVEALQITSGCARRRKARRSSVRRSLKQEASVCIQANAETIVETIANVRWGVPRRRPPTP